MISDEMKNYVLGLHKAIRENNENAIREYSRLVSECSKECKLTGFEFSFAFREAILFSDYLYWLVMYAKDAWEGAVDDGWANSELAKELKKTSEEKEVQE